MKDRTRKALENLLGQVVQARDGFGIYKQSASMDDALKQAEAALASQPSDLRAKLESLRELSEKATVGPWQDGPYTDSEYEIMGYKETHILFMPNELRYIRNAAFIVVCVNAVRAILEGKD